MKGIKSYALAFAATIAAALGFSACQDHFDDPDLNSVPVATMKPNATIAEIKELMWQDKDNYCEQVPTREDGSHYIISGRVVSSDYAGNCFKYIVLQDETGALTFSVNSYNLYLKYRRGQEVVVDLTGLHCGKYRGLFQVGFPSYNSSIPGYETSFMAPERFYNNSELNELPKFDQIDTIQVASFSELGVTPGELRRWQSQLVRFNNVTWVENSTLETLSTYHSSGETQQIRDSEGNTLDVRTSGYSNFWNTKLPTEACDVVAIVGYYMNLAGSGGWQLTLIDINSILNVGHPSVPKGNRVNPYSVAEAAAYAANGSNVSGWVEGYIVGTVGPEVETIASDNDIEWTATPTLGNTLVIGQTADTKALAQSLVIALPQGSDLRTMGALRENPDNYGRHILIRGTFASVMGANGITNNSGSTSEFEIEGKEAPSPVEGDGSADTPYSCAQIIAKAPSSTTEAVESGVWVEGYIVGYYENYDAHFEAATTQYANVLIADDATVAAKEQCVCIQLPASSALRAAVNLVDNPGNIGKRLSVLGDIMKYNTLPGLKNCSEYSLEGQGVDPGPTPSGNTVTLLDATAANAVDNWTFQTVSGPDNIWVWKEYNSAYYLNGSAYVSGTNNASEAWAISPIINLAGATSITAAFEHAAKFQTTLTSLCGLAVREEGATSWTMLTVPTWPTAGSWAFANSGDISLSAYAGKKIQLAFKYASTADGADTWEIRNLKLVSDQPISVEGAGNDTPNPGPDPEPEPADDSKGQFNTFNNGTPKATYGTYTNATGWVATNCNILSGVAAGGTEQNPRFAFIGNEKTLAPTLNGKVSAPGTLESPTLSGGINTLKFNYGFAYTDSKCSITIQVLQNGSVVKEDTLELTSFTQKTAYEYSLPVNVTGDFQIRIVNNSLSAADANKDRISIWNLTWD